LDLVGAVPPARLSGAKSVSGENATRALQHCEIANLPAAARLVTKSPLTRAKDNSMTMTAKTVLFAAALMAAAPLVLPATVVTPAQAQVVAFDFGGIGYGYRDGYVDRDRRYHRWQNAEQARYYRAQYRDYYAYENYDRNDRHRHTYRGR
jgi:hypothetical protein